jgi:hypothetical protein
MAKSIHQKNEMIITQPVEMVVVRPVILKIITFAQVEM